MRNDELAARVKVLEAEATELHRLLDRVVDVLDAVLDHIGATVEYVPGKYEIKDVPLEEIISPK